MFSLSLSFLVSFSPSLPLPSAYRHHGAPRVRTVANCGMLKFAGQAVSPARLRPFLRLVDHRTAAAVRSLIARPRRARSTVTRFLSLAHGFD